MLTTITEFLAWFAAVNRRAMRDVGALPPEADGWRPPTGEGEAAWDINTIVGHMAGSRLYFASAYRGEGWISPPPPDISSPDRWLSALAESEARFRELLGGTPDSWLHRKIDLIDTDGQISGWRLLLLMAEHDVHHRSQIDTYAGLSGWPVPDIFGRSAERIATLQPEQRRRYQG